MVTELPGRDKIVNFSSALQCCFIAGWRSKCDQPTCTVSKTQPLQAAACACPAGEPGTGKTLAAEAVGLETGKSLKVALPTRQRCLTVLICLHSLWASFANGYDLWLWRVGHAVSCEQHAKLPIAVTLATTKSF